MSLLSLVSSNKHYSQVTGFFFNNSSSSLFILLFSYVLVLPFLIYIPVIPVSPRICNLVHFLLSLCLYWGYYWFHLTSFTISTWLFLFFASIFQQVVYSFRRNLPWLWCSLPFCCLLHDVTIYQNRRMSSLNHFLFTVKLGLGDMA